MRAAAKGGKRDKTEGRGWCACVFTLSYLCACAFACWRDGVLRMLASPCFWRAMRCRIRVPGEHSGV